MGPPLPRLNFYARGHGDGVTFRSSSGERNVMKEQFAQFSEHLYVGEEED